MMLSVLSFIVTHVVQLCALLSLDTDGKSDIGQVRPKGGGKAINGP